MTFDWMEGQLAQGLLLYEAGEFFHAHEAWESVWLGAPDPEKRFLQGLIQVTAAFHHLGRGNRLGTSLLLKAALRRFEDYPETFASLSVATLCGDIQNCLRALEAGHTSLTPVRMRLM